MNIAQQHVPFLIQATEFCAPCCRTRAENCRPTIGDAAPFARGGSIPGQISWAFIDSILWYISVTIILATVERGRVHCRRVATSKNLCLS